LKKRYFVHPSSYIDKTARVGTGTKIWHFCHIMEGVRIGENCKVGQNVQIGPHVHIGNNAKIQNNVSVYKGVTLEEDVFCGPSCVFTNVYNPRSAMPRKDKIRPTLVKKGATIGANATIVCGNKIGRYAFVGAGSVITKDIPDYALVFGNPGCIRGWVCECGEKLEFNKSKLLCKSCKKQYKKSKDRLQRI